MPIIYVPGNYDSRISQERETTTRQATGIKTEASSRRCGELLTSTGRVCGGAQLCHGNVRGNRISTLILMVSALLSIGICFDFGGYLSKTNAGWLRVTIFLSTYLPCC